MKHIIRLFLLILCMVLLAGSAFAAPPDSYVVFHGDREVKKVAITVDDGWEIEKVRLIHDLSVEYDFPITWFMVGTLIKPEDKELWDEIIAHGSEIGNHTWKHSRLLKFSLENGRVQVCKTQERIDEVLGYHYPLRLLRPPYGEFKNKEKNFLPVFKQYGVERVILWDVSQTDPYQAIKDVQNGSILLYHTRQADYECLQVLVPMLLAEGYQLVTVSELLELEPLELPVPTATPRPAPTATPVPTATPEATAVPAAQAVPQATPAPTATPVITAAPAAKNKLTKDDVVSNGDRNQRKIAITVDDCDNIALLEQIHALSVEEAVPITYFVIGNKFEAKDKALWTDVIAHGSEIGNHTWKHSELTLYSISNGHTQVRKTQERVDEVLGYHYPLRLIRPPHGAYSAAGKNFLPVFQEYGVEKVVLWDVEQTNPAKALNETQNGSILLFHTKAKDYECLAELIPMLKDAGYELVTVSELLGLDHLVPDQPETNE